MIDKTFNVVRCEETSNPQKEKKNIKPRTWIFSKEMTSIKKPPKNFLKKKKPPKKKSKPKTRQNKATCVRESWSLFYALEEREINKNKIK